MYGEGVTLYLRRKGDLRPDRTLIKVIILERKDNFDGFFFLTQSMMSMIQNPTKQYTVIYRSYGKKFQGLDVKDTSEWNDQINCD